MISFDEQKLLKECSAENPCGENLEYTPQYLALERIAKYSPEFQFYLSKENYLPDWSLIEQTAIHLLEHTKDLRIAVLLAQASVSLDGFVGFAKGLSLIDNLLSRYWECMHPELDPGDNNDPTYRINLISELGIGKPLFTL